MRLTAKHTTQAMIEEKNLTKGQMKELKLSQLEDIEDELGIDLITLFKANLEGVYLKEFDTKFPVMIRMGEINHTITLHIYNVHLENIMLKVEDYSKTWALDKKDLTKEGLVK